MSSQKQSHRIRQYERWHENIVKENEELKKKVAYFERRPPMYRVFKYMKWKKAVLPATRGERENYGKRLNGQGMQQSRTKTEVHGQYLQNGPLK